MMLSYLHMLSPIVSLAVNVFIQVVCFKYIKAIGLLKSVFAGFIAGFLTVGVPELFLLIKSPALSWDVIGGAIASLLTYFCFGYCYFHFINMGETARRVRILTELNEIRDGLTMDEVLGRYDSSVIIDKRLARLINNGQVLFKNNRYYANSSPMVFIAKVIDSMKLVIMGKRMV